VADTDTDAADTHTALAADTLDAELTVVQQEATPAEEPVVTLAVERLAVMPAVQLAVDIVVVHVAASVAVAALAVVAAAMAAVVVVTGKSLGSAA
jgi:hypothetical protein